jgi:hypothetical protein
MTDNNRDQLSSMMAMAKSLEEATRTRSNSSLNKSSAALSTESMAECRTPLTHFSNIPDKLDDLLLVNFQSHAYPSAIGISMDPFSLPPLSTSLTPNKRMDNPSAPFPGSDLNFFVLSSPSPIEKVTQNQPIFNFDLNQNLSLSSSSSPGTYPGLSHTPPALRIERPLLSPLPNLSSPLFYSNSQPNSAASSAVTASPEVFSDHFVLKKATTFPVNFLPPKRSTNPSPRSTTSQNIIAPNEISSPSNLSEFGSTDEQTPAGGKSDKKRRMRTTSDQFSILQQHFQENPLPNATMRALIGEKTGMSPRAVQVW